MELTRWRFGLVLAETVAGLEERYAEEQRALVTEKLAEVRRESDEKVAKAKADSERRIAEAKAQAEKLVGEEAAIKIVADAKRQQEQLAQERKKKEDEAREAALEKEFERDLPQIHQSLAAFITHGFAYRDKKAPKGPISLAWLVGIGALENSRQGMERLTSVASHQNDRHGANFPLRREVKVRRTDPFRRAVKHKAVFFCAVMDRAKVFTRTVEEDETLWNRTTKPRG